MTKDVNDPDVQEQIKHLVQLLGGDPSTFEGKLIAEMIQSSLRLIPDGHNTGQLKLINRSLKEMRYAYHVFNRYSGVRKVSIFGSARTPKNHPDYATAKEFGAEIAKLNWMVITGAAEGIMQAGLEGQQKEGRFGLSIKLPFEIPTTQFIKGDPKLINFRYFFTRKLMFVSHSDAVCVFPGGFGTMDELFEVLTLIQTGKSGMIPVVLLEGKSGTYWKRWKRYVKDNLLQNGWISPEDLNCFYIAPNIEKAAAHIQKFYYRYHSSRYFGDKLVIRLNETLSEQALSTLNQDYSHLIKSGKMRIRSAYKDEGEFENLPRLVFHHTRDRFGDLRKLIDAINRI